MLVANNDYVLNWEFTVVIVLVNPLVEVVEAFWVRNIEDKYATVGSTIIGGSKSTKTFLTCSIPYLKSHSQFLITMQKGLIFAVDSNRCFIILSIG